jgi:hypothetical protein
MKQATAIWAFFFMYWTVGFAQEDTTYIVKRGDYLEGIAKQFDVKVDSICKWNNIKKEKPIIHPKQKLKIHISKKQKSAQAQPADVNNTNATNVSKQGGEIQQTNKNQKKGEKKFGSKWLLWFILGVGVGVGVGCWVWERWLRKRFVGNENEEVEELREEKKKLHKEKNSQYQEIIKLKLKIEQIDKEREEFLEENISLGREIERYQNKPKQLFEIENKTVSVASVMEKTADSTVLYSKSITDGFFNRVSNKSDEDTIFVLNLQDSQTASFTISPDAEYLVCQHTEFLDGCDKQILNDAQSLTIQSEGIAQKQPDGKWKVIEKLKVIIS